MLSILLHVIIFFVFSIHLSMYVVKSLVFAISVSYISNTVLNVMIVYDIR